MSNEYEVVVSKATPEEVFFLAINDEAIKQTIPRLNEALGRMVTLATALTGGAVALLKDDVCYGWWRVAAASLMFVALGAAVFGSVPVRAHHVHEPVAIMRSLQRTATVKKRWLWASAGFILAGLLAAIVGVAVKVAKG